MLFIHYGLDFTAMAIAGSFKYIKSGIQNKMTLLVHIPHWPIAQLAIVDNSSMSLLSITEGKGPTGELRRPDTLHLAFAHGSHG